MNNWKDDDEVVTTYGTIQRSQEQAFEAGLRAGQQIGQDVLIDKLQKELDDLQAIIKNIEIQAEKLNKSVK